MSFNHAFLTVERTFEYRAIRPLLPSRAYVLELGAGTGLQSKLFTQDGHVVNALDMPTSNYAANRVFAVEDYDGIHIPFQDATFDVVFSSSVLEHVNDLASVQNEIRRVLKPDGFAIHILPSVSWRLFTLLTGLLIGTGKILRLFTKASRHWFFSSPKVNASQESRSIIREFFFPAPHGESQYLVQEFWVFSRFFWARSFIRNQFVIDRYMQTGLFYSGHMLLGERMPLRARQVLARVFGSACHVFQVRPRRPIDIPLERQPN